MTEYLTLDSLESNRIEITFNIIPTYSCIVNKEVAIELIKKAWSNKIFIMEKK